MSIANMQSADETPLEAGIVPPSSKDLAGGDHRVRWRALRVFASSPTAVTGLVFLVLIAGMALLAPWLFPADPLAMVGKPLLFPGEDPSFRLGTDSLGRDVAAGVVHGARVSLLVGISAAAFGMLVGVLLGATAGYFGGWIDNTLVRLIEILQTMPTFVLVVVLVAITGPSITYIIPAIGLVTSPTIARLARAEFRKLREMDFVMAARSLGYGHRRIIFIEILPNALPPIIVTASVMVASAILLESALSFMSLGDPNVVTWGSMIGAGREHIRTAWHLTVVPGVAIVFTVLAFNLIGDGLNDALNPRYRQGE